MLHAIIIDDEKSGVISLELMLAKYCPEVKLVAKTTDALEGVTLINNYRPDVVFLDINMPNLNGFELLQAIEYKKFHLVFTTAHVEYALKALKENALDYLLKPIDADDLKLAIDKVNNAKSDVLKSEAIWAFLNSLSLDKEKKISVTGKDGIVLIDMKDVLYIEASSNQSVIITKNKTKYFSNKSLKDYDAQFCVPDSKFLRIHNSFIVNINYVNKYLPEDGGYAVVQDEKTIPISKHKKDEFLQLINFTSR